MTNSERAAYIRGLMDGLELDNNSKEVKVINAIVDLLEDLCDSVEEIEADMDELAGQVDEIDEDLADVEDLLYEDEDEDFDFEDDDLFEVACPHCDAEFEVSEEELLADEGIECPMCGELLTFDIEECDGDCSCCEEDCDNKE